MKTARTNPLLTVHFEPLLSAEEAAPLLNIHPVTLLRWAREKKVPFHRTGRKVTFRSSELDAWYQLQTGSKLEMPFVPPQPKGEAA